MKPEDKGIFILYLIYLHVMSQSGKYTSNGNHRGVPELKDSDLITGSKERGVPN